MAWLAVQIQYYNMVPTEEEVIFSHKPRRHTISPFSSEPNMDYTMWDSGGFIDAVILPKGTIKKLIGRELKWEDDPVEIK
jgi:hypothetical protein